MKFSVRPARILAGLLGGLLLAGAAAAVPPPTNAPVRLRPGDRVVLAGGAWAEALARDGTFEALLLARLPELRLTTRLAAPDAAALRREQAEVLLLVAEPPADWRALAATVSTQAFSSRGTPRTVLVTPPGGDAEAGRRFGREHGLPVADLAGAAAAFAVDPSPTGEPPAVTPWVAAHLLLRELGLALPPPAVVLNHDDLRFGVRVGRVDRAVRDGETVRLEILENHLPAPPPPDHAAVPVQLEATRRLVRLPKLPPGRWELRLQGEPLAVADDRAWDAGVRVDEAPLAAQAGRLRDAVRERHALAARLAAAPDDAEAARLAALLGEADARAWELATAPEKIVFEVRPAAAAASGARP
jgi:hypothetical protein